MTASGKRMRQHWRAGDVFSIATLDGRLAIGQVLEQSPEVLNSAGCALFNLQLDHEGQYKQGSVTVSRLYSTLFSTRDMLDGGQWKVLGNEAVLIPRLFFPYEELRSSGYVGAKVIGSASIMEFVNAYFALKPWDDWADKQYLDRLLLNDKVKPQNLVYLHR